MRKNENTKIGEALMMALQLSKVVLLMDSTRLQQELVSFHSFTFIFKKQWQASSAAAYLVRLWLYFNFPAPDVGARGGKAPSAKGETKTDE
jgi:hypothetical protein